MSTLKTNTIQHLTSGFNNVVAHTDGAGTTNAAHARAWVNFDGTGTVAIRAQFNVSSITDNGTGSYTVNFTNALSDTNYSIVGGVGYQGYNATPEFGYTKTTSSFSIGTMMLITLSGDNRSAGDNANVHAAAFR